MAAKSRKRPDWSRPLPQPLQILDENEKPILTLKTLGDVHKMLLGLLEPFQLKTTWGHVGVMLDEAARGETSWMSWCRCAWCWVWRALRTGRIDPVPRRLSARAGGRQTALIAFWY
jgi:hypothetical protein